MSFVGFGLRNKSWSWKRAALGALPVTAFGLGTWQVQRWRWKVALINDLETKLAQDAVILPNRINMDRLAAYTFKKYVVKGRFIHDQEMYLGPRTRDGKVGYHVITPLERQDGTRVLINRGWVASEFKDRTTRPESLESGEVVVKGLFRRTDETSSFVPKNRPDKNEWYSVDVAEMSEHAQTQPMFLDSIYEDVPGMEMHYMKHGIPLGRRAKVDLRNNHVEYIITWYSLAVITGVMFLTL